MGVSGRDGSGPLHRGVYLYGALTGPLRPARSGEMAAVLACGAGAVVSHESAASLWEVVRSGGAGEPVHVTHMGADRRRPGIPALREILDRSEPALTRSAAEERFLALVRKGRLPAPRSNARVGRYEVDFLWASRAVAVEVDGFAHHSSRRVFENDRRRDGDLAARGIHVVRVTWRQLVDEPHAVLVRVARTLARSEVDGSSP